MGLWEWIAPRRPYRTSKKTRWLSNLGMVFIDTLAVSLVFPGTAVYVASLNESSSGGLLIQGGWPYWLSIPIGIMFLDFVIYVQPAMFHAFPSLWRLHMMHHTDLDFDTTTGVRFHPLEILLSMAIKIAAVFVLGIAPLALFSSRFSSMPPACSITATCVCRSRSTGRCFFCGYAGNAPGASFGDHPRNQQ